MRLNLKLFLYLIFFAFSCSNGKEASPELSDTPGTAGEMPDLSQVAKDTLVEATSTIITNKIYRPDSIRQPKIVPMVVSPKKVKTRVNSYPISSKKILQNSSSLVTVTPGKYGTKLPKIDEAKPKIVPIVQTEPVEALPPRMKDVATYDIQYLDVDQGLISSYIRSIMEDKFGNLWFGSSYGVSHYDGDAFIQYTAESGLTDDMVVCMLEDKRGDIWFGTGTGLTFYDGDRFIHYTESEGFEDVTVRDIFEDSNGDLWFGTTGGLIRYERDSLAGRFIKYTEDHGLLGNHILSIGEDKRGYMWFGSDKGLVRYDGTNFTQYTTASGLISDIVNAIFKDSRGDIWFGTNNGVSRYDGDVFINYSNNDQVLQGGVYSIVEDKRGDIWFGTDQGVFHYETKLGRGRLTQFTQDDGLSNSRVRCIVEDSEGNLWFGTGGGGANRLNNNGFVHFTTSEGLTDNGVVFIIEDKDGTLWYGTDKGLNRYQGDSFIHYTTREGLLHNDVRCGLKDQQGRMWFGTAAGISRFDGYAFTNYTIQQGLPDDNIISLMEDSNGWFWMGTGKGVCHFNPQNMHDDMLWITRKDGLLNNRVYDLLEDQEGNIWMASESGLTRYAPRAGGGTITNYTKANGLLNDYVSTLMEDSEGKLWIGTKGGLNLFNEQLKGDQFIDYTVVDSLGNNMIWSIVEDRKKNIWVSTEKGITLMKPREEAGTKDKPGFYFNSFDKNDGLKRLDFAANSVWLDQQNRIWWGSEGATMLDLSKFELATQPPRNLHLTHIEINQEFVDFRNLEHGPANRDLPFYEALSQGFDSVMAYYNYPVYMDLPHKLDHLTFHFSAIAWDRPHRVEYQYYLEGLEETWSARSREPLVDYRNLSFGHYTFKVRALGDSGVWSEPLEYPFHIRPAPWWSWWAWTIYVLLLLGVFYVPFYLVKKRWKLKSQLIAEKEKSDRVQRRESFRSRLYTNLTHEFRTPLNVILGMAEQIESNPARYLNEGVDLIQRNGNKLLRLINQLLDLAKLEDQSLQLHPQRGNIISYLHYYTDSFKPYARKKNLSLSFETNVQKVITDYDPEQVGHIMTNLISNAVKFTPSGGFITVRLDRQSDTLIIEVADTGIGIAEDNIDRIFKRFYQVDASTTRPGEGTGIGLAHTFELVKLMKGDIGVESQVGLGTTFRVSLPIHILEMEDLLVYDQEPAGVLEQKVKILAPDLSGPEIIEPDIPPTSDELELPRVLIVEDDHDTMTHLVSCLADKYQIDLANNGQMGLDKALETIPDLIISDVMMPEKSGYDLCSILKNDDKTSHIPIILLTAKADIESKIKGLATGADAYLYKPFKKKELLVRLEVLMDKQRKLFAHFSKKFEKGIVYEANEPETITSEIPEVEDQFVERVRKIVAENYHQDSFSLMNICEEIGMSRSQLYRKMKALIGISPSDFIRKYRLEKAKILLETTDMNASQVAYATGYKDLPHFSKSFSEEYNIQPSSVGKKSK